MLSQYFSKKINLLFTLLLYGLTCWAQTSKVDLNDYEKVKPYLSIRIYNDASIAQKGGVGNMVSRVDLDGTMTVLMLDLPEAFAPLFKTNFEKWNKSAGEVFKVAELNVRNKKVEKMTREFDIDGNKIEFNFLGNEDYAASYALNLETNMPELVGEWGSIVVIPNKGLVAICKISKAKPLDFVKFIERIKPLTDQSFAQHQVPVSKNFFWYYKGEFTLVKVLTNDSGNINVIAPLGLGELMSEKK